MNDINKVIEKFEDKEQGYQRVINICSHILLRPNDYKSFHGEDRYNIMKEALEIVLNKHYKDTEIYKYYYELNKVEHGFCMFERWKRGLLF